MPLIKPASNPIMNMTNEIKWIETVQGIFGMLAMILLMLIVRDDVKLIPRETAKDKIFFSLAVLMIVINFLGWTMYYMGYQYGWLPDQSVCCCAVVLSVHWTLETQLFVSWGSSSVFCDSYHQWYNQFCC